MASIFDRFDGYVIPSHLEGYEIKNTYIKQLEPVHYWTVTITLTSGDVETFYVKARNKKEAIEKAKFYEYLATIKFKGEWRLLP